MILDSSSSFINCAAASSRILMKLYRIMHKNLKGEYHQSVSNVRYADVSLTTVRREWCFAH